MIKTEKRSIVEDKEVTVEYVCDVCGRREAVSELPEHWVELTGPWETDLEFQLCQPGCLFKKLSEVVGQGEFYADMPQAFILSLVEFAKPFFARGELD